MISKSFCKAAKIFFSDTANGAYPLFGQLLKSRTGRNSVIGVSDFRIINISAYITFVFFHFISLLNVFIHLITEPSIINLMEIKRFISYLAFVPKGIFQNNFLRTFIDDPDRKRITLQ